jgi:thiamine transport system permease protein
MDRHVERTVRLTPTSGRRAPRGTPALAAVGVAFVGLLALYPFARLVWRGLGDGRAAASELVRSVRIRRIAWFTLWQAAVSTALILGIAIVIAACLAGRSFRGKRAALVLAAVPFTLPTVVVGTAFLATLPADWRQGRLAIICAHIFFNVGVATRTLTLAAERLDAGPWEAARTLGASPIVAWRTVTLSALRGTIVGLVGLVGTLCLTSFGVVLLLGGPKYATVDVEIYRQALQLSRIDRAAALATLQFVAIGALLWWVGRRPAATSATRTRSRPTPTSAGTISALTTLLAIVALPIAALVRRSLQTPDGSFGLANYRNLASTRAGTGLSDPPLRSLIVSLQTTAFATTLTVGVALALTIGATRVTNPFVRRWCERIASLPLAVSAVTLGLGVLIGFSGRPLPWRSSPLLLPALQAVVCLPFVTRTLLPAFQRIPRHLDEAAATLGASPWRAWATVDLRLASRALAMATGLGATVALGEFGAASLLARPRTPTVPIAIARLAGRPGAVVQGQAAALAVLLAAIATLLILVTQLGTRSPT